VSSIFKKISPKTFGPKCVHWVFCGKSRMKLTRHQVNLYNLLIMKKIFHNFLKSAESNPNTPPYSADIRESPTSTSPKHQNTLPSSTLYTTTSTKYTQTNAHTPSVFRHGGYSTRVDSGGLNLYSWSPENMITHYQNHIPCDES